MKGVVIGGGLAGITAAVALAQAGADVTLLEAKPRLGGATMSFTRDDLVIDTGQHVFLGAAPPTAACSTGSAWARTLRCSPAST